MDIHVFIQGGVLGGGWSVKNKMVIDAGEEISNKTRKNGQSTLNFYSWFCFVKYLGVYHGTFV